jgi:hypothetical protein
MPGLRASLTGSANRCLGRSLAVTALGVARIASSTESTKAAELSTFSILTTVRTFTTALRSDFGNLFDRTGACRSRSVAR